MGNNKKKGIQQFCWFMNKKYSNRFKRIIIFVSIIHFLVPFEKTIAQSIQPPSIIYPSPTSREMQKFLGYPVSPSTGLIDISVPLYEIKAKQLSIPLQLKYHSSGIRIQDGHGFIGYGWSFFPGFKISRTIMGKPDDRYHVVQSDINRIENLADYQKVEELINYATPASIQDIQNGVDSGQIKKDGQYDLFTIHLPNLDASFILECNLVNNQYLYSAVFIPDKPYKITPYVNSSASAVELYAFDVTDDHGVVFKFGEQTHSYLSDSSDYYNYIETTSSELPVSATGWMLREIVQPNGDVINFSYKSLYEYTAYAEYTRTIIDNGSTVYGGCDLSTYLTNGRDYTDSGLWGSINSYKILVPDMIETNLEKIEFSYQNHSSLNGSDYLSSIEIFSKSDLSTPVKTITLNNESPGFLNSVNISGEGNYAFEYNMMDEQFSGSGIDWWGYFNGNINNQNPLPNAQIKIRTPSNGSYFYTNMGTANREPDATYMKAKSLKKITYPTGGNLEIFYSPHCYIHNSIQKIGAGLRVDSTRLYDNVSNRYQSKKYIYEDAHLADDDSYPDTSSLINEIVLFKPYNQCLGSASASASSRTIHTFSPFAYFTNNTTPVWYGKVTEYTNEGRITYTYENETDDNSNPLRVTTCLSTIEVYPYEIKRFANPTPRLLTEKQFKKNGSSYTIVTSIQNYYTHSQGDIHGLIAVPEKHLLLDEVKSSCFLFNAGVPNALYYELFGNPIVYKYYSVLCDKYSLSSTVKKSFFENDSIVDTENYIYDSERPYNIVEKETYNSDNLEISEKFYYTNNAIPDLNSLTTSQQDVIQEMDEKNYLTTIIENTKEKNGNKLYSNLIGFKEVSENLFLPETSYLQIENNAFQPIIRYLNYDSYGNPLFITKNDAINVIYLWSYKGHYPIAEIKNSDFSEITNFISESSINAISSSLIPTTTHFSNINNLRANLPNALITTFTYKPLVGILTETDPRGLTTTYDYDTQNRLVCIKDNNLKILKKYNYHYAQ